MWKDTKPQILTISFINLWIVGTATEQVLLDGLHELSVSRDCGRARRSFGTREIVGLQIREMHRESGGTDLQHGSSIWLEDQPRIV